MIDVSDPWTEVRARMDAAEDWRRALTRVPNEQSSWALQVIMADKLNNELMAAGRIIAQWAQATGEGGHIVD